VGAERIQGELLKLGLHISKRTVQNICARGVPDLPRETLVHVPPKACT
jgi:hypothetical protein